LEGKVAAPIWKPENTAVGIRHADYATLFYPQKLVLTSPTGVGRSVGIVRSRIHATEFLRDNEYNKDVFIKLPVQRRKKKRNSKNTERQHMRRKWVICTYSGKETKSRAFCRELPSKGRERNIL
jgi:hypothetical protein